MIAVDTNVLVYAHRKELPQHPAAARVVRGLAEGAERWAVPVFCLGELLRVLTHRRVFDPPHTVEQACTAVERLLGSPTVVVLRPGPRYAGLLLNAVREAKAEGNLAFDAQIAALCREHGTTLLTADRDFDRFEGLQVVRFGA